MTYYHVKRQKTERYSFLLEDIFRNENTENNSAYTTSHNYHKNDIQLIDQARNSPQNPKKRMNSIWGTRSTKNKPTAFEIFQRSNIASQTQFKHYFNAHN